MILKDETFTEDFGQELTLDLYECNLKKISDGESIREYIETLCDDVIFMKRYGEPLIPHFGHENPITSGYSLVQLIETSCVSGHFSEYKKAAYINIFSCKWFDAEKATKFTKKFFGAKKVKAILTNRE